MSHPIAFYLLCTSVFRERRSGKAKSKVIANRMVSSIQKRLQLQPGICKVHSSKTQVMGIGELLMC